MQEKGVWGQRRGDLLQGMSPQPARSVGAGLFSWEGADRRLRLTHLFGDLSLWCRRRLLRAPWTARRCNRSILKEMDPEYSLEGLMLKLKLQYFGHLMQRTDSLKKTLMLGKIESRRRRGLQRIRRLNGHEFEQTPGDGEGKRSLICCLRFVIAFFPRSKNLLISCL